MRSFFLITAVIFSATAAHAGLDLNVASADPQPAVSSSVASSPAASSAAQAKAQMPDPAALAAKRQAMMQQKMAMQKQKQMMMMREMALHPIRTRVHFAVIKIQRAFDDAF